MGCWNETCMISQLPIPVGERIKYFVLLSNYPNNLPQRMYYTHDIYAPIYLPLTGDYDDYGGIENIEKDVAFQLLTEHFSKKHGMTLTEALDVIQEDELSIVINHCGKERTHYYTYAMVPESIYEEIVDFTGSIKEWWHREHAFENNGVELNHPSGRAMHEYRFQKMKDKYAAELEKDAELEKAVIAAGGTVEPKDFSFRRFLLSGCAFGRHIREHEYYEQLLKAYLDSDLDNRPLIDFYLFIDFLNSTRKVWMGQSGAGSQSDNYPYYAALANATLRYCGEHDCGDDEDDEESELPSSFWGGIVAGVKEYFGRFLV